MNRCCTFVGYLLIFLISSSYSIADHNPSTPNLKQDNAERDSDPSIRIYLTLKRMLANNKHQTLSVELFDQRHGERKRIEGGTMGDLFIDIEPYSIADIELANPPENKLGQQPKLQLAEESTTNQVFHLSNAPAIDVAKSLNEYFENEASPDGKIEAPKILPETISNTLIVSASSRAQLDQVQTMATALDTRPPMFKAKLILGRKDKDGSISYISRPHIVTTENLAGRIQVGQKPIPGNPFEAYEIEVTMRHSHN